MSTFLTTIASALTVYLCAAFIAADWGFLGALMSASPIDRVFTLLGGLMLLAVFACFWSEVLP